MRKFSVRKNPKQLPLLAFLFILLSIPVAVYGLINLDSFDIRNRAADTTVQPNTCIISFPFVNPQSIEVNKLVQVEVSAYIPEENISQVTIMDRSGKTVFTKDYTNTPNDKISESFTFTSSTTGEFSMLGTVVSDKSTKPCVIADNRQISVITTNLAPEFKSLPAEAKPGNAIKVKDSYEYLLKVEDAEKDTINYAFSFTPGASWLKYTVLEDGGDGKLTIKFTGIPDKPASYLANIFVHDGYNQHLKAQSWVISVDQDKNDVPKVSVYAPSKDTTVTKGAVVKISWEATDLNMITKYEVFLTTNPGNQNTWIPLEKNLSNKVGNYLLDTSTLTPGTYQVVIRATDNYNPPAQGVGVSPRISVDSPTPDNDVEKPDDGVILTDPQIINISPSNNSKLKNKKATISATLIAGTQATVKKDSIKVEVNDKDVTKDITINEISDSEVSLIYATKDDFKLGKQKVSISFKDSKGNEASKNWTFSIIEEETNKKDVYNIFGYEIPKRTAWIIGGGILLLLLAILIPWILYLLWRGSKEDDYETIYNNTYPVSPSPTYTTTEPLDYQEEKVEEEKKEEPKPEKIESKDTFIQNNVTEKKETVTEEPKKPGANIFTSIFSKKEKPEIDKKDKESEDIPAEKPPLKEKKKEIVDNTVIEEIPSDSKPETKVDLWTPALKTEKVEKIEKETVKEEVNPVEETKPEETKIDITQNNNITKEPISSRVPADTEPVLPPIPAAPAQETNDQDTLPQPTPILNNLEPQVEQPKQESLEEEPQLDVTEDELTQLAEQLKAMEAEEETKPETSVTIETKPVEEIKQGIASLKKDETPKIETPQVDINIPTTSSPTVEIKLPETTNEQPEKPQDNTPIIPATPTSDTNTQPATPPVVQFNSPKPQEDKKDNLISQ